MNDSETITHRLRLLIIIMSSIVYVWLHLHSQTLALVRIVAVQSAGCRTAKIRETSMTNARTLVVVGRWTTAPVTANDSVQALLTSPVLAFIGKFVVANISQTALQLKEVTRNVAHHEVPSKVIPLASHPTWDRRKCKSYFQWSCTWLCKH